MTRTWTNETKNVQNMQMKRNMKRQKLETEMKRQWHFFKKEENGKMKMKRKITTTKKNNQEMTIKQIGNRETANGKSAQHLFDLLCKIVFWSSARRVKNKKKRRKNGGGKEIERCEKFEEKQMKKQVKRNEQL